VKNPAAIISFGQHLRRLRKERGFSQQALADEANLAKQTIYRIEKAQFTVTLDVLVSLSEALEMPLKELVDFPQDRKPSRYW
jgi:transcriptional regulator with XRE-family HTH domain